MNKYIKSAIIAILILIISSTAINTILADELIHPVLAPSYIVKSNVLRGGEYSQEIYIENIDDIDHNVTLDLTGDIKNWASFYELNNKTIPITSIFVNKSSYIPVLFMFTVPLDASNRIYYGNISAIFKENDTGETGVHVQIAQIAPVFIQVTGNQTLNVSIIGLSISNVENGFNAKIKVDFQNTGNVLAKPLVEVTFNRVGSENIGDIKINSNDYNSPDIKPGETKTYYMEWNTEDAQLAQYGNYSAYFNITLEGKVVYEKTLYLEIYDKGSRLRDGRLDEIKLIGKPEKGKYAQIFANFTNTGEIEIYSQFNGSVYLNGKLLQRFNSSQVNVNTYQKANFTSIIPILEDGQYEIKGHIYYYDTKNIINGETEELEVTFSVGYSLFGIDLFTFIIIFVIVILIIFLIVYKRRFSKPKKSNNTIKSVNKKNRGAKKSTSSMTSKGHIRIARNKEKSPFKAFQDNNTKENENNIKKSEK